MNLLQDDGKISMEQSSLFHSPSAGLSDTTDVTKRRRYLFYQLFPYQYSLYILIHVIFFLLYYICKK